jgi:general secretion pathway protein H
MKTPTSPAGNNKQSQAGFTLIELGVVIFIIAMVAALALPRAYDLSGLRLRSEARQMAGMIRYLYTQSVFTKNSFMLNFDIEKGEYWVEYPEIDHVASTIEIVRYQDQFIKEKRSLPDNVVFTDIITARTGTRTEGKAVTLFSPSGFVEPTTIHIKDKFSEDEFTLYIQPLTGKVKVLEGYFLVSGEGEIE